MLHSIGLIYGLLPLEEKDSVPVDKLLCLDLSVSSLHFVFFELLKINKAER